MEKRSIIFLLKPLVFFFYCFFYLQSLQAGVQLGVESLFSTHQSLLSGKQIGLVTNHTAIDSQGNSTIELFKKNSAAYCYKLKALFAPEHGLMGL